MYINSTALERFVNGEYTSLFYVFGAMGSLILLFILPRIIKSFGLVKTSVTIFALLSGAMFLLGSTATPLVFTTVFVLYSALTSTIWYCSDLFVAHYTDARTAGHTRGMYLTIVNSAVAVMPVFTGLLVARISIGSVYIVAAVLLFIGLITVAYSQRTFIDRPYVEATIPAAWNVIKKSPSLRRILSINFLLQFFYVWMTVFTPLYMSRVLHFNWTQIGSAFSVMLLAFVLFQYQVGKLSDKVGEKKLLLFGFTFAGISTIAFALAHQHTHSIIIYAAILFCTRVGICMVEVLSETYFFKQITDQDEGIVSVYTMMHPLAYVIAPLLGWLIIIKTSYSVLFIVLGILLLTGALYTIRLIDIR